MINLFVHTPQGEFTVTDVIEYRQDVAFVEIKGLFTDWVTTENLYAAEVENV